MENIRLADYHTNRLKDAVNKEEAAKVSETKSEEKAAVNKEEAAKASETKSETIPKV